MRLDPFGSFLRGWSRVAQAADIANIVRTLVANDAIGAAMSDANKPPADVGPALSAT